MNETQPLNVKIILASVREGRFGDKPAKWIEEIAKTTEGLNVETLDLKDWQLPVFAQSVSPAYVTGSYGNAEVDRWAGKIAEADAFIIVTPEYNHGYPATLKNHIDCIYKEWNMKPVCFVAYGSTGGARVTQQLREVAVELQMSPIRNSVHIMAPWFMTEADGSLKPGVMEPYVKSAHNMLEQLKWWAAALKVARESK